MYRDETHLNFSPGSFRPSGIFGDSIDIGPSLDSLLEFTGIVQNSTVAVHEVHDRG
jgi:hypothetical protein